MGSSRFCGIGAKQLCLSGTLRTRPSNNSNVLESVLVQRVPRELDRLLALIPRQMLSLAITALDQNTRHAALYGSDRFILSSVHRSREAAYPRQAEDMGLD